MSFPRAAGWLAFAGLLGFGLLGVHAPALRGGFDVVPGDLGDARIMAFLLESGWRAILGEGTFRSPPMFFPETGVRGLTDGHLLWLPVYGALRLLGLDMLRAMSVMFLALLAFGYATAWLLFRRALRIGGAAASVGAFLFMFGSPLTLKLVHGQMVGTAMLPVLLLLVHAAWRDGRVWPAVVAGVGTGLLAATSYIVAWFFVLIAVLALAAGLVLYRPLRAALRRGEGWPLFAGFGTGLAVGLVPFVWIYGAQILHGPRRSPGEPFFYRPSASDLLNIGPDHPVWGRLLAVFGVPVLEPQTMAERMMGSSPPVWVLAGIGALLLWRGRASLSPQRLALLWAALAAAAATAAQFRYFPHGYAWQVVFHTVPGAAAIRTTFRSALVTLLPVAGLLAVALDAIGRTQRRALGMTCAILLGGAALLESVGIHPSHELSASAENRVLAAVPAPPAGCRVFALAPQPAADRTWWMLQSDALMLALHWRIPTMNGNSSWTPPGWQLRDPAGAGYAVALAGWTRAHGLADVACLYDAAGKRFLDAAETGAIFSL